MVDSVFVGCAVLGGGVFVVRTLLQLLGVGNDDLDIHHDADAGFRILSLQGLSAFLMMFGLVGLALTRESGASAPVAIGLALLAGVGAMLMIGQAFKLMARLQSSGTLHMDSAVGQEGSVYLTIASQGQGKVEVIVQGRLGVFEARTQDGSALPTGRRVRVVSVEGGDVLVVQPIASATQESAT